ncbi:hypothetical protein [Aquirufa lenticrescens]|uniref:hypothetical protein n=1 Tax=Aquirufa lenticrescens TaxID=2696560 RepID=UPI001CAA7E2C|nr:hypothetical protein [Aquirufa lenticrescens]UAJ13740.1 hypothetical protein G9X62_03900 [Aquirufa lenticrescens]
MKANVYVFFLSLVVVGVLLYNNYDSLSGTTAKSAPKPLTAAESKAALNKWETSPDGVQFKNWESSPAGKKVHAGAVKINKFIRSNAKIEGVVSSLSLPEGARLGFGVMVNIEGEEYILSMGPVSKAEMQQLKSLKVNDKIVIKSRGVSKAPKYAFAIVSGDYLERDSKVIYKRIPNKGGC